MSVRFLKENLFSNFYEDFESIKEIDHKHHLNLYSPRRVARYIAVQCLYQIFFSQGNSKGNSQGNSQGNKCNNASYSTAASQAVKNQKNSAIQDSPHQDYPQDYPQNYLCDVVKEKSEEKAVLDPTTQELYKNIINETIELNKSEDLKLNRVDNGLLEALVFQVASDTQNLESQVKSYLKTTWDWSQTHLLLKIILQLGYYELKHHKDIDASVIISEYVNIAYIFFGRGKEAGFINAVLQSFVDSM